jgi:hypothetical protein
VKTHVSHTSLFSLFPSFQALSANTFELIPNFLSPVTPSWKFPHCSAGCQLDVCAAYRSLDCELVIRCLEMFSLYILNSFINSCVIFNSALIWYFGFECAVCQFAGMDCKYFLFGSKDSSTMEHIHDGRNCERKRNSLHFSRGQGTERGNEIEEF